MASVGESLGSYQNNDSTALAKFGYSAAMDGLRAISILLVVVSHAGFGKIVPGGFGVTVFFFISGFLITTLLLQERMRTGRVSIKNFYIRRFIRLMPAFIAYLILASILLVSLGYFQWKELGAAAFFLSNYYKILVGFSYLNWVPSPFNILWSLAIEEHFYFIYAPLFLLWMRSSWRLTLMSLAALLVIPLILRLANVLLNPGQEDYLYNYSASECRLDSMAFGVAAALFVFWPGRQKQVDSFLNSKVVHALGVLLLLVSLGVRGLEFRETWRYTLQGIGLAFLVPALLYGVYLEPARRIMSHPYLVYIGKVSYSMYLHHWLALVCVSYFVGTRSLVWQWQLPYWCLTIVLSIGSYHFIEKNFVNLRHRFSSSRTV